MKQRHYIIYFVALKALLILYTSCENNANPVPSAPKGETTQNFCDTDIPIVAHLVATGSNITWYSEPLSNVPLNDSDLLVNGMNYYATQTINGYESEQRFSVTAVISHTEAPKAKSIQRFCSSNIPQPTIMDIKVTGVNVRFYLENQGGESLLQNTLLTSRVYYATQTIEGCESKDRLPINVIVSNICHDSIVLEIEGAWICNEHSDIYKSTAEIYNVTITPSSSTVNEIYIYNFYYLQTAAKGNISGYSLTIPKQIINGGYEIEGSGIISQTGDEINLVYNVGDGSGLVDHCTGKYTRGK